MFEDTNRDEQDRKDKALPAGEARLATVEQQPPAPAISVAYPEEEEVHLKEYLQILRRYAWVILTFFTITLVTTAVWTYTQLPLYTATAIIKIEREEPRVVQYEPVAPGEFRQEDYYKTQYEILKSRSLARRVIDRLRLAEHREFQPSPPGWWDNLWVGLWNWLAGFGLALPHRPAPIDEPGIEVRSPVVDAFLERTSINPVRRTQLVEISFDSHSPALAPRVANTIADSYMALNLEQRLAAGRYARQFLSQQLEETRGKLEASELRLAEFLRKEDIVMLPGTQRDLTAQHLSRLTDALLKARTERMEKEIHLAQARGLALDLFPNVLENQYMAALKNEILKREAEYRELRETYKPQHPKMTRLTESISTLRQQLRTEAQKFIRGLEAEYQAARRRQEEIEAALQAEQDKAQRENRTLVQYNLVKREVDTNREIYSSLLQRLKETDVTSALTVSNIEIVERAMAPRSPSKPRKGLNLLLGAVMGLLGGVGLAFFFAYMDTKLRTPEEVERTLHLPTLGSIPALASLEQSLWRSENGQGPFGLITHKKSQSQVSEFFRHLRTSILFSSPDHPPRSLLFTSLQAGEGKTSTTLNTAISLAQLGGEVLIIDADLRHPDLHLLLNLETKPGLSEFLTGQAELHEVLRSTEIPGLYAIPAGHLTVNPADLFGSGRMGTILDTITCRFRHILIDTPPLLGMSDALVLASRVEAVILVLQDGRIEREMARRAVGLLRGVRARLLGTVVNRVDIRGNGTYGYAYYSDYGYNGAGRT